MNKKKVVIGILEDEEALYYPWELEASTSLKNIECKWLPDFETCFENLSSIDILIADWEIRHPTLKTVDILENHIEKIKKVFKGPIAFYSNLRVPDHLNAYFDYEIRTEFKRPPKIDTLLSELGVS